MDDGIWSCKGWPYYSPSSSKISAFAPPFSADGVSVSSADSAEFEEASDSNYSPYGNDSFSKLLRKLDSAPFNKPSSNGYSGFQFMDPPSSQLPRLSSTVFLSRFPPLDGPSLNHYITKSREIKHPCQSPSSCNQFFDFNKGSVKRSDDGGALRCGSFSKRKEASPMPITEGPVFSNSGRFLHLDLEPKSSNNAMLSNCNIPMFKARFRIPNPPAANFSRALHPELMDKIDECLASALEGPKDFNVEIANNVNVSCEISNKNQVENEVGSREKGLGGHVTKFSLSNFASQEFNSDVGNDGPSYAGNQFIEEKKFMSQNLNSLCRCTDVGFDMSECLKCSSSREAENGTPSPSFIVGEPEKTSAPAPKIDIQMLVKMMHNMSELLLGHCLTGEFQLNGRDRSILDIVISNLRTCALKNPEQRRLFPELDSGNPAGESSQLQQNAPVEEPCISKVGPEPANAEQGKERGSISDSSLISGDSTEMKRADNNMTKAMKTILSENFHDEDEPVSRSLLYKNLWLEAEAELCSIIYRARFNRMIAVEKYSSKHGVKGEESITEADYKLSPDQNSANDVNSYDSAELISALDVTNSTEPADLKLTPGPNEPIASQHEVDGSQNVDSFIQDSTAFGTNKANRPFMNTADQEDLSNSVDYRAREVAPILAFDGTGSPKTQNHDGAGFAGNGTGFASESPSLKDGANPETLNGPDADVNQSILEEFDLDLEDNQEIHPSCYHRSANELVTEYSHDSSSDWELVSNEE
ncbi:uncharacterized protein LOC129294688 [Prosopis cineraria]|uniref:uncharacterized protein LOC129294688 n=1 Tax=Prosopis cineraria TaxID=364024 RepID=UPI0024104EAA|nr:uncharacterized protein LOC129294688 [Prosopis cineraria]